MDVRTMALMGALVGVLLGVLLFAQYRFARGYPGLGWWAAGQAAVALGFVVSLLRGDSIGGHIAVPTYQALLVLGSILIYVGVQRFLGRLERRLWLAIIGVGLVGWAVLFTFVNDSAKLRSIALYLTLCVLLSATGLSLWRRRLASVRGSATFLAVVFLAAGAIYLVLAGFESVRVEPANVFFAPSPINAAAFLTAVSSMLLWTVGLIIMVNQRLSADVALEARNMRSIFAMGPDCAIISRRADGVVDDVNDGFTRLTGFTSDEVVGKSTIELGMWAEPEARDVFVKALASGESLNEFPMVLRRRDGSTIECSLAATTITLDEEPHVMTVFRDVTAQRQLEAQLQHEAATDSMTGLPNRRHFLLACEQELRRSVRSGLPIAVALIDIDHFKDINDTYGHAVGDDFVVAFAEALKSSIRDIDTFGRLGGDEFGLLLPNADLDSAIVAVDRVRVELAGRSLSAGEHRIPLRFSAGVAVADHDDSVDTVLAQADAALYEAKTQGRGRVAGVGPRPSARP